MQTDISQRLEFEPRLSGKEGDEEQRPTQMQQAQGRQAEQQFLLTAVERTGIPKDRYMLVRVCSSGEDYVYGEGWWDKQVQVCSGSQRHLILSTSASVLPGNRGSRGRMDIKGTTMTCNEAAQSSGACRKRSDGRVVSRRVLGGEQLQLL